MNKLEKTVALIVLIALILKLLMIPYSSSILGLSMIFLSLIYLLFGFAVFNKLGFRQIFQKNSYVGLSVLKITGSICTGIILFVICTGILFKILHFNGSNIILITVLIPSLVILLIATIKYLNSRVEFYKHIMIRLIIYGTFGLILSFL